MISDLVHKMDTHYPAGVKGQNLRIAPRLQVSTKHHTARQLKLANPCFELIGLTF